MSVVVATTLVGLAVVFVALLRDDAVVPRGAAASGPDWDALPEPADLARVAFPFSVPGYDPATVDVHFEALSRAYETLWSAAPPDVRERARMRAQARAARLAAQFEDHGEDAGADDGGETVTAVPPPPEAGETDSDALRVEAALAPLEQEEQS